MQRPGFLQQRLDHLLLLVITALSPVAVAPFAGGVEEVMGRPGLVVERLPDPEVVIDSHRVPDPQFLHLLTHVIQHFFMLVLGGVHADHHQAVLGVLVRPLVHVRQAALTVDAVVGPEIHQHHFALQRGRIKRR